MTYTPSADRMIDTTTILHDGTANITADALGTVGGSAAAGIVNIGSGDMLFDVSFDFSAVDTTTGDEVYTLQILGSNQSDFSSDVAVLAELRLGDATQLAGGTGGVDTDKGAGRYVLSVRNRVGSSTYAYARVNFEVAGTSPILTPAGPVYIAPAGSV